MYDTCIIDRKVCIKIDSRLVDRGQGNLALQKRGTANKKGYEYPFPPPKNFTLQYGASVRLIGCLDQA